GDFRTSQHSGDRFLTPQNVTVKHSDRNTLGATGFEPATSWSQTTRSTKLSYAPFCETMLTITNPTSHPENSRSQRREMTRHERRMTNDEGSPNDEARK